VEFVPDPDGEVGDGDILIHSELVLPSRQGGLGQRTRRISTMHVGNRTTVRERISSPTRPAASQPIARLSYSDDAGPQTFEMVTDLITIGRGGAAYRVDVRITSSADVSREHLRIRWDGSGRFYVSDLSMLGTTVNGKRLPKGYDEVNGERTSNGVETPLVHGSRIGLADTVYLDFAVPGGR
jgi:pSer/pThr/pTyr-binding forkhead associated (FHA) protein